jgi:hypothetical protein
LKCGALNCGALKCGSFFTKNDHKMFTVFQ